MYRNQFLRTRVMCTLVATTEGWSRIATQWWFGKSSGSKAKRRSDYFWATYVFLPRKSTTDTMFALRMLMEAYREGQKEFYCVFVDLEKAHDWVPREELWFWMKQCGGAEKNVRLVQEVYESSMKAVRCAVGITDGFKVEVGRHQRSAVSNYLWLDLLTLINAFRF